MKLPAFLLAVLLSFSLPDKTHPHNLRAKVVVPSDTVGVMVEVEDTELNFYRSSAQETREGQSVYMFDFRGVPSGEVHGRATVRKRTGKEESSPVVLVFIP